MMKLLSPAGDLQKLIYAVRYGADAVYLGGTDFSMRANAGNFTDEDLTQGIKYAHDRGVSVNVAINVAVHNHDILNIINYTRRIVNMGVDGLIVSDPGVIDLIKNEFPEIFLTLSTQANTTNYQSLNFWKKNGINRVVLARELTFQEIKEICVKKPKDMEVEVFVHGAMCMSYSGRCMLSYFLANRDANRGDCAQPCRWKYTLTEKNRPNQEYDIVEDGQETYIFNSKDLCLIRYVKELMDIGVDSLKIEGRMKTNYYVATVTNAYKTAIKRASESREYVWNDLYEELTKVSHRQYTEAFYNGLDVSAQNYETSSYVRNYDFVAEVSENTDDFGMTKINQRNKFLIGDEVEILSPEQCSKAVKITKIKNSEDQDRLSAPHADEVLFIQTEPFLRMQKYDLIRRKCLQ